jgi:transposase
LGTLSSFASKYSPVEFEIGTMFLSRSTNREIAIARPSTKFAKIISVEQEQPWIERWKSHHCHYTRVRAHAILLSNPQYDISSIVDIFGVERDSVSSWIDRFSEGGSDALEDSDHPGAPPILNDAEQQTLRRLLRKYPNQPGKVLKELKEKTGKEIKRPTLRVACCKCLNIVRTSNPRITFREGRTR